MVIDTMQPNINIHTPLNSTDINKHSQPYIPARHLHCIHFKNNLTVLKSRISLVWSIFSGTALKS